jgi:hypothetical protein
MKRRLTGRHRENQPAMTGIDTRELKHVAEKGPVCFGVFRIDNYMSPVYHGYISPFE